MRQPSHIVHFEIQASDPDRARDFYEQVLGWQFSQPDERPHWLIHTGSTRAAGLLGTLRLREGPPPRAADPVNAAVLITTVADLSLATATAVAAGGSVRIPRTAVPRIGWLAHIADPDGNLLGLLESDPEA